MLIDTDVHPHFGDLVPHLPAAFGERWNRIGPGLASVHEGNPRGVPRRDAATPDGGPPASDPAYTVVDHLDRFGIDYAVLTGPGGVPLGPDDDYLNAVAAAYNDVMLDVWHAHSPRFLVSIVVNSNDPDGAVREIRRVGHRPGVVQILMGSASRAPYGQRHYHAIYAAAVEAGLPVAIHPGADGAGIAWPPTPVGYPSRYLEWHNILPITYLAQINSLVCEGVFEKFPDLRFVAIEGGVAWLPHLLWRMDKNYKALRDTVPWLRRLPSEYVLEHVRLTTQPIEEPNRPAELLQILDMIDAGRTVMFSSDYPHWDNDDPRLILQRVAPDVRERIMGATAAELYGLAAPAASERGAGQPGEVRA